MLGIQEADPREVLLLADIADHKVRKTWTETAVSLSELGSFYTMLAYRYPSKDQGPLSGNHEIHIMHRCPHYVEGFCRLISCQVMVNRG